MSCARCVRSRVLLEPAHGVHGGARTRLVDLPEQRLELLGRRALDLQVAAQMAAHLGKCERRGAIAQHDLGAVLGELAHQHAVALGKRKGQRPLWLGHTPRSCEDDLARGGAVHGTVLSGSRLRIGRRGCRWGRHGGGGRDGRRRCRLRCRLRSSDRNRRRSPACARRAWRRARPRASPGRAASAAPLSPARAAWVGARRASAEPYPSCSRVAAHGCSCTSRWSRSSRRRRRAGCAGG